MDKKTHLTSHDIKSVSFFFATELELKRYITCDDKEKVSEAVLRARLTQETEKLIQDL